MQRRAIDFPDAAALVVMQNIVQGHFEEGPRAEPELHTDSMMETDLSILDDIVNGHVHEFGFSAAAQ